MKKVLFVFNHPAPYKVRLLNELSKFLDLTVIFERVKNSDRNKQFYFEENYKFKTVHISGLYLGRENIISKAVKNHIKHNKYDLIIMNGYSNFSEMIAISYLKKHHIPYCLYINGGIAKRNENFFKRSLKRKYISSAAFYLSPDENSNNYLVHYGAFRDKIFNYPYSTIYESEILPKLLTQEEIQQKRKEKGLDSKYLYVSCGQLIKRKNYMNLVKVWPTDDDKLLVIIGDGKQRPEIEEYIRENHINNVKLLGFLSREELFKYYQICDVFIFPSNEDIYGHVINEAMSQGLPVVSTPYANSARKLIKNGINGYIIDHISSNQFIEAIDKVLALDKNEAIKTARENTLEKMAINHKEILLKD